MNELIPPQLIESARPNTPAPDYVIAMQIGSATVFLGTSFQQEDAEKATDRLRDLDIRIGGRKPLYRVYGLLHETT